MIIDADIDEGEVDEDPPTRSEYDQTNKGESITIMEVIAGTDVKKKDDTVVVATEGDTHGKIIGYNCGYYDDCDYWDEYGAQFAYSFLYLRPFLGGYGKLRCLVIGGVSSRKH